MAPLPVILKLVFVCSQLRHGTVLSSSFELIPRELEWVRLAHPKLNSRLKRMSDVPFWEFAGK